MEKERSFDISDMAGASFGATCPFSSVGQLFDPFRGEQLADPYPTYARARREEPIFYSPLLRMWYVTRYDDILTVVKDPQRYSSADAIDVPHKHTLETQQAIASSWIACGSLTNNDPPGHNIIRRLVNKAFTAREIATLESSVREVASRFIDRFAADGQAEVVEQFDFPLSLQVILDVLGAPTDDPLTMRRWADDWLAINNLELTAAQQTETMTRLRECERYWLNLIAERKANPKDDLLNEIIKASEQEHAPIPLLQIVNICMTVYVAGHQTTTDLIGLCLRKVLSDAEQWRLVCEDKANIPRAVEETLRVDSPVHALMRTTTEAVVLNGVALPQGARLALLYASANHDEAHFQDSAKFDLRRDSGKTHLAFGHGIHFCVGAPLARMVARVAIELLVARLPGLRMASGQKFEFVVNPIHRGLRHLVLEWDRSAVIGD